MTRIAITGPESTGKSWLTAQLAAFYQVPFVPEYSREYLDQLCRPYTYPDILTIAQGQLKAEEELAAKSDAPLLFSDTDLLVTFIWCQVKYGKVHPWIMEKLKSHRYHHYLLCDIDLAWQPDPLREHPHRRKEIFALYVKALEHHGFPFTIVRGEGETRLMHAVTAVNESLIAGQHIHSERNGYENK